MVKIRAVAADIDGTLTDNRRHISTVAIDTLRKVEEMGIPVILASGNVLPITWGLARFLGVTGPVVAENGGLVCYKDTVYELSDGGEALKIYARLKEQEGVERLFTDQWRRTEVVMKPDSIDVSRIRELVGDTELAVVETGFGTHLMSMNVSKYTALLRACELIDVDITEVMALGDGQNDAEMILHAGVGVAVANARDEVKAVADYVTEAPNGDGVVEALTKYLRLDRF